MAHHVSGIFSDPQVAERAVDELIEHHFNRDEISVLVTDHEGVHEEEIEHDTGVAEGAAAGLVLGSLLGTLGTTLVATGIVAAPGLMIYAAGPLLLVLKGAVGGAAVGFEVGALAGLGSWKEEVHIHADDLRKRGIVVSLPAEHDAYAKRVRKVFREAGAEEVRG